MLRGAVALGWASRCSQQGSNTNAVDIPCRYPECKRSSAELAWRGGRKGAGKGLARGKAKNGWWKVGQSLRGVLRKRLRRAASTGTQMQAAHNIARASERTIGRGARGKRKRGG
jgi:hypothetical protein